MTDKAPQEKQDAAPADRLGSLVAAVGGRTAGKGPAPVHLWNPPFCGDIAMHIAADGTWFYQGSPIARPAMVALFAGILRKADGQYELVTPVERVGITVADAPFVAVAMERAGDTLRFVTNIGDEVEAGSEHPMRFGIDEDGGVKPYVHIRGDLWARLTRTLAVDLLSEAEEPADGSAPLIRSAGSVFPVAATPA